MVLTANRGVGGALEAVGNPASFDIYVERQVEKSAAALLLESRIGEQFDSIVTGTSENATWAQLLSMPVEGKLVQGFEGLDVGDRIWVQLTSVDVQRGFIDFRKINSSRH